MIKEIRWRLNRLYDFGVRMLGDTFEIFVGFLMVIGGSLGIIVGFGIFVWALLKVFVFHFL